MADKYYFNGQIYNIDPDSEELPEGHYPIGCPECKGSGHFRGATELRRAHFVHSTFTRLMYPSCSLLSNRPLSKAEIDELNNSKKEKLENYLENKTPAELKEIIRSIVFRPIVDFYEQNTKLVDDYNALKSEHNRLEYNYNTLQEIVKTRKQYKAVLKKLEKMLKPYRFKPFQSKEEYTVTELIKQVEEEIRCR